MPRLQGILPASQLSGALTEKSKVSCGGCTASLVSSWSISLTVAFLSPTPRTSGGLGNVLQASSFVPLCQSEAGDGLNAELIQEGHQGLSQSQEVKPAWVTSKAQGCPPAGMGNRRGGGR